MPLTNYLDKYLLYLRPLN